MIVANVMTRNPTFVSPDMSINDAKELMLKEKIGKLPVLDKNNRLIGLVTKKLFCSDIRAHFDCDILTGFGGL